MLGQWVTDLCLGKCPGSLLEKREAPPSLEVRGDGEVGLPVTKSLH